MPCSSIVNKATGQVFRPAEKKRLGKKLNNINQNGIDYCKLKTCTYNSFAAITGLTAIDQILVAVCVPILMFYRLYKLGLLYLCFCGCYIETTTNTRYWEVFPVD